MSVFLGNEKVGVSYATNTANMFEDQRTIMRDTIYTPWVRPEGWPDLDSLNLEMSGQESFVYMTYRTGHVDDVCNFKFRLVSGTATVELGTVTNGAFIATSTITGISSNTLQTFWFTSSQGYSEGTIVVKATGRFDRFYLVDSTNNGITIKYYMQPMLERIWYMPDLISFYDGSSSTTTGNGTYTIERDKIANGTGTALTSLYYAWCLCQQLQSLDVSGLYTPNVTNMGVAFDQCRKLEVLDIAHFDTSKVTTFTYAFYYCQRLKELDFSSWNTQKLTTTGLTYAFSACNALKEIKGLEKFYINNITTLAYTFFNCYSLEDLSGVINWNVSNVTSFSNIFSGCSKIKKLNLSNWDISAATTINGMFNQCRNLEHIDFPQTQTNTIAGSMSYLFSNCFNLQEVNLTWIKPITNKVTSLTQLFCNCHALIEIHIPEGWDITGCTSSESCTRIFSDCWNLQIITGISNWDMSNYNYTLAYSFQYDYCLKELDISNWCPHPTNMYYAFYECESLEEIDLTGWHWEKMTGNGMASIFSNCTSLKTIKGIEHMGDSGEITSFTGIFYNCYSLTSLSDISSWNPTKVTTCSSMFYNCYALESLTITNWSLPQCTAITNMFRQCYNMKELELTGWSLPALTTTPDYIFYQLYSLQKCSGLPIGLNHRYQEDYSLTEDQWIRIFTQLPTVSNKTLYISTANINRLSATTKAIATNKGWTLAN